MQHSVAPTLTDTTVAFTLKCISTFTLTVMLHLNLKKLAFLPVRWFIHWVTLINLIKKSRPYEQKNHLTSVMSSIPAALKTVIKNAVLTILQKNTVSITAKEAVNTVTVP